MEVLSPCPEFGVGVPSFGGDHVQIIDRTNLIVPAEIEHAGIWPPACEAAEAESEQAVHPDVEILAEVNLEACVPIEAPDDREGLGEGRWSVWPNGS